MKKLKYILCSLTLAALVAGCDQEIAPLEDPITPQTTDPCAGASKGNADFTKFVALGNSFMAGYQAGALYNEGQDNSLGQILANQFGCAGVGGTATFNQPEINAANGYNLQSSIPGVINLGRMVLFDPDGTGPRTASPYPSGFPGSAVTCPSAVTTPALPAPYNTADVPTPFAGDKNALNNFSVPLVYLGQALIPETGNPGAGALYNPLWARFAKEPGVKSMLQDALGAAGSFYAIWLGFDDVLLYAATGADGTYPMTSEEDFDTRYKSMIGGMLAANTVFKGVVGNIPNFTSLPYFYTVGWNAIKLDATSAAPLQALSTGYNGALLQLKTNGVISEAEYNKRLIAYKTYVTNDATTLNGVLLVDEELTDLSPYLPDALDHMAKARQATAQDMIPLAAGSVLGTCYNNMPTAVFGVSFPVADKYALTTEEISEILERTAKFNASIDEAVATSNNRLAIADVKKAYADLVTAKAMVIDGVTITPSFAPPTGAFSVDGLHPNSRGYAYTANAFISAINAKFGASITPARLSSYGGTGLPVNP